MTKPWLLALFVVTLNCAACAAQKADFPAGCSLQKCTPYGDRFARGVEFNISSSLSPARVIWTRSGAQFRMLSRAGCSSAGAVVVCGPRRSHPRGEASTVLTSLNATGDEQFAFDVGPALGSVNVSLSPIVDSYGDVIYNDLRHACLVAGGDVQWTATFSSDIGQHALFSATVTSGATEILVFASESGLVFSYTTNGVPVAGVNLAGNTTVSSRPTHTPVAMPVSNETRVYVLSRSLQDPASGRLYCFDVENVAVSRMRLVNYTDLVLGQCESSPFMEALVVGSKVYVSSCEGVQVVDISRSYHVEFLSRIAGVRQMFVAAGGDLWLLLEGSILFCPKTGTRYSLGATRVTSAVTAIRVTGQEFPGGEGSVVLLGAQQANSDVHFLAISLDDGSVMKDVRVGDGDAIFGQPAPMPGSKHCVVVVITDSGIHAVALCGEE